MGDIKSIDTLFDFCSVIRSMALTPHQLVVKDVNETKWIEFNHGLSTVFNVDILIEQSSITYVNMTNLYSMQSKSRHFCWVAAHFQRICQIFLLLFQKAVLPYICLFGTFWRDGEEKSS